MQLQNSNKDSNTELAEFHMLQTREDVSNYLGISDRSLRYFLYKRNPENMYRSFTIPKRRGGFRKISAPEKELRSIQRILANRLNIIYKEYGKASVHGFVKDKNSYTNAMGHCSKKYVLNIDLSNFFDQINYGRIYGTLIGKPFSIGEEAAKTIARLCCFEKSLPQGAPSSPVITNMVCRPLDNRLIKLARKYKLTYTRYADDITLSSRRRFSESIFLIEMGNQALGAEIRHAIEGCGFVINENKIRYSTRKERQEVTGLVVNQRINVRREYIRNLRAMINNAIKHGFLKGAQEYYRKGNCKSSKIKTILGKDSLNEQDEEQVSEWYKMVLKGKLEYLCQIRKKDDLCVKYTKEYDSLANKHVFALEYDSVSKIYPKVVVIENSSANKNEQGSGFFLKGVGLVSAAHVLKENEFYKAYYVNGSEKSKSIPIAFKPTKFKNKEKDYIAIEIGNVEEGIEIGNSQKLMIGDEVTLVGFPDYHKGASHWMQKTNINSIRNYLGYPLFTVNTQIFKGASGGVVLDVNYKAVGIIISGIASDDENEFEINKANQGFRPLHLIDELCDTNHLTNS